MSSLVFFSGDGLLKFRTIMPQGQWRIKDFSSGWRWGFVDWKPPASPSLPGSIPQLGICGRCTDIGGGGGLSSPSLLLHPLLVSGIETVLTFEWYSMRVDYYLYNPSPAPPKEKNRKHSYETLLGALHIWCQAKWGDVPTLPSFCWNYKKWLTPFVRKSHK